MSRGWLTRHASLKGMERREKRGSPLFWHEEEEEDVWEDAESASNFWSHYHHEDHSLLQLLLIFSLEQRGEETQEENWMKMRTILSIILIITIKHSEWSFVWLNLVQNFLTPRVIMLPFPHLILYINNASTKWWYIHSLSALLQNGLSFWHSADSRTVFSRPSSSSSSSSSPWWLWSWGGSASGSSFQLLFHYTHHHDHHHHL